MRLYITLFLGIIIIGISCKKKDKSKEETPILFIGQSYQGGIVAYIYQSGDPGYKSGEMHGLISATNDIDSILEWGCANASIIGADDTSMGSGNQNTIDIINGCTKTNIAAKLCADLDIHGYSDWYLPNKQELNKLYINRALIGGFNRYSGYWSSSEYNSQLAWGQDFNNAAQGSFSKNMRFEIRPIRSF